MGYKVEMECPETQVGAHSAIGYRSGERLPVGHPDVAPDWRPVVVEVDDEEPTGTRAAAPATVTGQPPPPAAIKPQPTSTSQTGANK